MASLVGVLLRHRPVRREADVRAQCDPDRPVVGAVVRHNESAIYRHDSIPVAGAGHAERLATCSHELRRCERHDPEQTRRGGLGAGDEGPLDEGRIERDPDGPERRVLLENGERLAVLLENDPIPLPGGGYPQRIHLHREGLDGREDQERCALPRFRPCELFHSPAGSRKGARAAEARRPEPDEPLGEFRVLFAARRIARVFNHFSTAGQERRTPTCVDWFVVKEIRTVHRLLESHAARMPDATAIIAPGRSPLSYRELLRQTQYVVSVLNSAGVGRNDVVAVALPNGPELATALFGVMAGATCAPLNPALTAVELDPVLEDLNARALVTTPGANSPAVAAARARNVPVIELTPLTREAAGRFSLSSQRHGQRPCTPGFARPDDVGLVLHTSGTTSRPKLVPATHEQLVVAADAIATSLALTERDRCLNVVPLFHGHGLRGALLASVSAGGSIVCMPGFDAAQFFDQIREFRPSWYKAMPTIHQTVVERASRHTDILARYPLRFVRSGAAGAPPTLLAKLEATFGVPAIDAFSMTECAQIASNPLPPRARKPGSVGVATGAEIGLMDEDGRLLPAGERGEIVVRGPTVATGYMNDPEATRLAWAHGWFHTGDEGYLDEDGYLFVTGRIKELINRGGQKISPAEVDEVLLAHPSVLEAVAFGVPHVTLGEDVAAAVTLRPGFAAVASEVRSFAAQRLAPFKVPRRIEIVDQIPRGPTGKPQRLGLAATLGLAGSGDSRPVFVPARTATERALADLWRDTLHVDAGLHDDFVELGGNSLLAAELFTRIQQTFGKNLPITTLLEYGTLARLANRIDQADLETPWSSVIALQKEGVGSPFFCIHGGGGYVSCFADLARQLGSDRPFYGIQARGLDGMQEPLNDIVSMAGNYVEEIQRIQPRGPYLLGGFSAGGIVALEVARQLQDRGQAVALLAVIDFGPALISGRTDPGTRRLLSDALVDFRFWVVDFLRLSWGHKLFIMKLVIGNLDQRVRRRRDRVEQPSLPVRGNGEARDLPARMRAIAAAMHHAVCAYTPRAYAGRVALFRARPRPFARPLGRDLGWRAIASEGADVEVVAGYDVGVHEGILYEPRVQVLAQKLRAHLDRASARAAVGAGSAAFASDPSGGRPL